LVFLLVLFFIFKQGTVVAIQNILLCLTYAELWQTVDISSQMSCHKLLLVWWRNPWSTS